MQNEDRRKFLKAFGLGFCSAGNHTTDRAYLYDNTVYCPDHLPPAKPRDPPSEGRCDWGKGHWAPAIWHVGREGKNYCLTHLRKIVHIATWMP